VDTIPEYNTEVLCPHCNVAAVALEVPGSTVYWCENGHVSVRDPELSTRTKLVHEFKPEDQEANDCDER